MRLLQITASYKPAYRYGGPIVSVAALCEALVQAGVDVEVYTTTANGKQELDVVPGEKVIIDGVPVTYFRRISGDPLHFSPALLSALWKKAKTVDVVHVHAWWNAVSVLGALVAFLRGKPVVISPRGNLSAYSFGNRSKLAKGIIQLCIGSWLLRKSRFHVTSAAEELDVAPFVRKNRPLTLPNLVELPRELPIHPSFAGGPVKLGFFSRIEEKKGLDILLQALAGLDLPHTLAVAGAGAEEYMQRLRSMADSLGVAAEFVGQVPAALKFDVLAAYDILVLPSRNENFANVVIESLAVGTPVVVSDQVGLSSYIRHTGLGWVCAAETGALAACIREAILDTRKRQAIREKAPAQVRKDFDRETLVSAYIDFYGKVIHERV